MGIRALGRDVKVENMGATLTFYDVGTLQNRSEYIPLNLP